MRYNGCTAHGKRRNHLDNESEGMGNTLMAATWSAVTMLSTPCICRSVRKIEWDSAAPKISVAVVLKNIYIITLSASCEDHGYLDINLSTFVNLNWCKTLGGTVRFKDMCSCLVYMFHICAGLENHYFYYSADICDCGDLHYKWSTLYYTTSANYAVSWRHNDLGNVAPGLWRPTLISN